MESPTTWPEKDEAEMEEEEEEEGDDGISKKLMFDCAETPFKREIGGVSAASKKQSVVVYLRVRPKSQREILSMDASCLHLVSQRELQAVAPITSQTFKNKAGSRCPSAAAESSGQQFSFTHIFGEQATQREVFEEALVPTLRDFFAGQNCLVFTYGVTNSGVWGFSLSLSLSLSLSPPPSLYLQFTLCVCVCREDIYSDWDGSGARHPPPLSRPHLQLH